MMHDMTSFIGPLSSVPMRAPCAALGWYLSGDERRRVSGGGAALAQAEVQLGDVDPHDLLAEEGNEFFDAGFEHLHTLALLRDDAAPLLLQTP